jgi:hypothetical protein
VEFGKKDITINQVVNANKTNDNQIHFKGGESFSAKSKSELQLMVK